LKRFLFLLLRQMPLLADLPGEIDFFTSSELKLIVGPGDQGEPVITILLSDED